MSQQRAWNWSTATVGDVEICPVSSCARAGRLCEKARCGGSLGERAGRVDRKWCNRLDLAIIQFSLGEAAALGALRASPGGRSTETPSAMLAGPAAQGCHSRRAWPYGASAICSAPCRLWPVEDGRARRDAQPERASQDGKENAKRWFLRSISLNHGVAEWGWHEGNRNRPPRNQKGVCQPTITTPGSCPPVGELPIMVGLSRIQQRLPVPRGPSASPIKPCAPNRAWNASHPHSSSCRSLLLCNFLRLLRLCDQKALST